MKCRNCGVRIQLFQMFCSEECSEEFHAKEVGDESVGGEQDSEDH
jgi:hypothetical protein